MKTIPTTNDESGFILITTLVILVILTFIGIAGTRNSAIELQIAGNDRIAKEIFYDAESATMETAGRLNNEDDPDELIAARTSSPWLNDKKKEDEVLDPEDALSVWKDDDLNLVSGVDDGDQSIRLAALDYGILAGGDASSLKMTTESVHGYKLFGYAKRDNSWKMIELGYKKRF